MAFPNPPRTWAAAETVTAALMNAQLRDALLAVGTWNTGWTPAWTQATTNPTLGNGTLIGRYTESSDWVDFFVHLVIGSTTSMGTGQIRFDLPVTEAARRFSLDGTFFDTSASDNYPIKAVRTASDQLGCYCDPATAGSGLRTLSQAVPVTVATGDEIYIAGRYSK